MIEHSRLRAPRCGVACELPRRSHSRDIEVFVRAHDHGPRRGLTSRRGGVGCDLNLKRLHRLRPRVVDRDVSRQLRCWNPLVVVGCEADQCHLVGVGRRRVQTHLYALQIGRAYK